MFTPIQGNLIVGKNKFAIIASRFNDVITRRLVEGAIDCLSRHGAAESQYDVYMCPGSFEIPVVAKNIIDTKKFNAVLCLGAVIRGDTPHFDYIASEVTKGIAQVALQSDIPVVNGVLTTDTMEQALERAGLKSGNKGWDAALSAIEMVNLFETIHKKPYR